MQIRLDSESLSVKSFPNPPPEIGSSVYTLFALYTIRTVSLSNSSIDIRSREIVNATPIIVDSEVHQSRFIEGFEFLTLRTREDLARRLSLHIHTRNSA